MYYPFDRNLISDKSAFIGTFALGLIFVLISKWVGAHQAVSTLIVVALMIGYAVLVHNFSSLKLRPDQVGDNCYYLGLLFTLTSMAIALYRVSTVVAVTDDSVFYSPAEVIIGDFGIALGSTIIGVFLRVFMQQMRTDPQSVEESSRLDLAAAAQELRAQMTGVTDSFRVLAEGMKVQLSDYQQHVLSSTRAHVETLGDTLAESAGRFLDQLDIATAEIPSAIKLMDQRIQAASAEIEAAASLFRSAVSPLSSATGTLDQATTGLGKVSGDATKLLGVFSDGLRRIETQQMQMLDLTKTLSELLAAVPERDAKTQAQLTDRFEWMQRHQSVLEHLADRQIKSIEAIEAQQQRSIDAVSRAQSASADVLLALTEVARTVESGLRASLSNRSQLEPDQAGARLEYGVEQKTTPAAPSLAGHV